MLPCTTGTIKYPDADFIQKTIFAHLKNIFRHYTAEDNNYTFLQNI